MPKPLKAISIFYLMLYINIKFMNKFWLSLINVISSLPKGTNFSITSSWCQKNGINASPADAKALGKEFAKVYSQYNCGHKSVSPSQGTAAHKSSNNLSHYIKF